ncbi:DUF2062 domain-containing protein [Halieaceae bacterium IMCC14734]|uniref:DUF2062 domain-containing protein n=1 Tax=Candidatus Litorirhabdus singularis TaxID=2518993 RepID=A0ABT3TGH6_9GAMM|nr:DUF2062 domain-containing protein [Candidatus Litorirhabdus singularis]
MPKRTFRRITPSPTRLRRISGLHLLGDWIYQPNLWHINRHSSAAAFFVGLFIAFMPVPGQMIFAALAAIWLRANLPLSVALCWITNPLTIGPIFFLAYKLGAVVLDMTPQPIEFELSWQWINNGLLKVWQPFLLGCLLCGTFFGCLGYFLVSVIWRWDVVRRWEIRKEQRARRLAEATRDVELRQAPNEPPDAQGK